LEFCEEGFLGKQYEGKVRPYLWCCLSGITIGTVLHDGRISGCPELAEGFVQGDVRKERFKDVWEQRFQTLRDRSWSKRGACDGCGEFGRCQGGALHLYPTADAEAMRCLYLMAGR
jgi:radical SAM protein with 4Fe4S-binding SPASM domain